MGPLAMGPLGLEVRCSGVVSRSGDRATTGALSFYYPLKLMLSTISVQFLGRDESLGDAEICIAMVNRIGAVGHAGESAARIAWVRKTALNKCCVIRQHVWRTFPTCAGKWRTLE